MRQRVQVLREGEGGGQGLPEQPLTPPLVSSILPC